MTTAPVILDRAAIDAMIGVLEARGHRVVGPVVRSGAVVLGDLSSTADLPVGISDEQTPGRYRLTARDDEALFGYVVGPSSAKPFLHATGVPVWQGERTADGSFETRKPEAPTPVAFIGIRPCDLAAIGIQDKVFLNGYRDGVYGDRREGVFSVVVNCVEPGGTCFCTSMGTGPRASKGYDIAVTEVIDDEEHWFLAEPGSDAGQEVLAQLGAAPASDDERVRVERLLVDAADRMGRGLDTEGLPEAIKASMESPRWDEIAKRCMACANCTLVCPTCFCATVEDETDLAGMEAQRIRRWDSCFNEEFSYIHGGSLRPSTYARYRQWLTHKLSTWVDQFGEMGCVGCGRCITWCPVGIDITVEAAALAAAAKEATHV